MSVEFWMGLLTLPAAAVAVAVALWLIAHLWGAVERWWDNNGPVLWRAHKLPAGTIEEPTVIVGFRKLAGVFAGYAVSKWRLSFCPLPNVYVLVGFGERVAPPDVRRALERKLGEIEDMEIPYPAHAGQAPK